MSSNIKIALISDIHYGDENPLSERQGHIGDELLERAVKQLNAQVRPDVALVLGDSIDEPAAEAAAGRLGELAGILELLDSPVIMIPGNHDLEEERFYEVVQRPPEFLDLNGVRFVCFIDPEEPGWCARRPAENIKKMYEARREYEGPIVALQHVPVFPPGTSDCPFHYTNIDEVLEATRANGIILSVAGHYHPGVDLIRDGGNAFLTAPALCEAPFCFSEIELSGEELRAVRHALE